MKTQIKLKNNLSGINKYRFYSIVSKNCPAEIKTGSELKIWEDIPGPKSLPIIGQLLHYVPYFGSLDIDSEYEKQKYLYDTYGPIVRFEGLFNKKKSIYLLDPEYMQQLYKNEFMTPTRASLDAYRHYKKVYNKSEDQKKEFTTLLTEEKDAWKHIRTAFNPILMKPNVVDGYQNVIDEVSAEMVVRIKAIRDKTNRVPNLRTELAQWALESISSIALGGRIYGLNSEKDSPQRRLIDLAYECAVLFEKLDMNPKYGLWRFINTPTLKKAMNLLEEHDRLTNYFIERANSERALENCTGPKSLFQKLYESDPKLALSLGDDALMAGVYTTSSMVSLVFYFLATNPRAQNKLRQELTQNKDSMFLKAVIKESMRMIPVFSRNKRTTTKDQHIGGYLIPKDTTVTLCHHFASMQENQFQKPQEFIPERWLVKKNDSLYYGNSHPYSFMPFGQGIRMCVGKRIADLEMQSLVSNVIKTYQISWSSTEKPIIVSRISNFFENVDNLKFDDN